MSDQKNGVQLELFEQTPEERAEKIFRGFSTVIELRNAISDKSLSEGVRSELLRIFQTDPRVKDLPEGL